MNKKRFTSCLAAVTLLFGSLVSSLSFADDIASSTNDTTIESEVNEAIASDYQDTSEVLETSEVSSASDAANFKNNDLTEFRNTRWGKGISIRAGVGPAMDLLDPCVGYSARIGFDIHDKYWGVGLDVAWNTVWSTAEGSRPNHRIDFADKTSNSGLMLIAHGYLPTSDHFIISLGAGIGFGARYEDFTDNAEGPRHLDEWSDTYKSNHENKSIEDYRKSGMMDVSWLARFDVGAMWLVTDNLTIGFDMELNLGNYWSELPRWNSDDEMDISLGAILTFSYQFFM